MVEYLTQWPVWYLLLPAYCLYLSIDTWRRARKDAPPLESTPAADLSPQERSHLAGYRLGKIAPAVAWFVAAVALLTGATWVRAALVLVFLITAPTAFRDYAVGFATGRKSAHLAAAPEYVMGRARAGPADYAAAAGYIALSRLLPAAALLYALWRL